MTGVKMGDELATSLVDGDGMKVLCSKTFWRFDVQARNLPEFGRIHANAKEEWFPPANP
jgi:hypothetical protein